MLTQELNRQQADKQQQVPGFRFFFSALLPSFPVTTASPFFLKLMSNYHSLEFRKMILRMSSVRLMILRLRRLKFVLSCWYVLCRLLIRNRGEERGELYAIPCCIHLFLKVGRTQLGTMQERLSQARANVARVQLLHDVLIPLSIFSLPLPVTFFLPLFIFSHIFLLVFLLLFMVFSDPVAFYLSLDRQW